MLTQPVAEEIRKLRASGIRPAEIAPLVGVSVRTVADVLTGKATGRPLSPLQQFELDGTTGWAPLCMEPDEWTGWRAKNPLAGAGGAAAARPCHDCPLGFAADMRAEQRCNGTPGGVQQDEDLEEVDEEERTMDPVIPITVDRRVDVDVAAPCPTCVHAGICRIQPSLEALARLAVSLPVLDSAVHVELSAHVGCVHYARAKAAKPATAAKAPTAIAGETADRRNHVLAVLASHDGDVAAAAAELGERPNVVARIRNAAQARQAAAS